MIKTTYLIIALIIANQSCSGQNTPKIEITNKDFNWTITVPENFESVSSEDWAKVQNRGSDAIEKTYGKEIVNYSKTIFVFKSNQMNYFESNYQPFDPETDGDFLKICKAVNNMLYGTFKAQMPGVKIDTTSTVEKIDGLEFQRFTVKALYQNGMTMTMLMFNRLFGKREFTVNIMYVDKSKGDQMLDSWRKSKFN
jgi:hypothetical protein